jgi:hypothetical protein
VIPVSGDSRPGGKIGQLRADLLGEHKRYGALPMTGTTAAKDEDREAIRRMLAKRYRGAIDITDDMVDAVMAGIAALDEGGE